MLNSMGAPWTVVEEEHLIESLELNCDIVSIANALGRSPPAVGLKIIHLYQKGRLVVMSEPTYEAWVHRRSQ
ncbi:MAG TPA: hypothetical protein D7H91_00800 [Candidatus Poseidoniales archaeon]|nr:MAG TPA: hypothetical protein D7H91_00800 [Candidatus Poseidoniales archaeon]